MDKLRVAQLSAPTVSTLQIQFLGRFDLSFEGAAVVGLEPPRIQSLLAYLVLNRNTPQPRRRLAYLFWPDSTEQQARNNLRKALHRLRNALPDADRFLSIDADSAQWRTDGPFEVDVSRFEQLLAEAARAEAEGDKANALAFLQEAVGAYGGDLLPDCYDDWALPERERLRERYIDAMARVVEQYEQARDVAAAIREANRLLRVDPLHEETYRRLMRLHALCDDRAAALRAYQTCAAVLRRELDVEPDPATQEAYDRLLSLEALPRVTAHGANGEKQEALVGRQAEWQRLFMAWQRSARGGIHLALITGQAGIGKSRLAEELYRWVGRQGFAAAYARAYAAAGDVAYAPIVEWLRAEPLRDGCRELDAVWQGELARLLPELLVENPELPRPEPLAERWQRKRFLDALAQAILAIGKPLLLWLDDMQWCDQETLEWLAYLFQYAGEGKGERKSPARLLVVGTARSEEMADKQPLALLLSTLRQGGQLTELELGALSPDETAELAADVTGERWSAERAAALYAQTEGYPLFVVEMLRGDRAHRPTVEQGGSAPDMPQRVQAVIQARLGQLSPAARELAGLAATIGRAFPVAVLTHAAKRDEAEFVRELDELWQRRILREQGNDAYDFSHDKIREVAYAGVSPARRRLLHREVAEALVRVYADELDAVSGQVAAHYAQSDAPERAVEFFARAADVALHTFAYSEANHQLQQGLALLERLPTKSQRLRQELKLQLAFGVYFQALVGPSAPEMQAVYLRANELADLVGSDDERIIAMSGLANCHFSQCRLQLAEQWREEMLSLAKHTGNRQGIAEAQTLIGIQYFFTGRFRQSRTLIELALADLDYPSRQTGYRGALQHLGKSQLGILSCVLWNLGYPDQSLTRMEEALVVSKSVNHPYSYASVLNFFGRLHQHRREPLAAQWFAEEAIEHAKQQGAPYGATNPRIILGWALAQQGEIDAGITHMREALAERTATKSLLNYPHLSGLLADGYRLAGQVELALQTVAEALAWLETSGERTVEAELYRSQGELLRLQEADPEQVETCYRRALAVAREQEAKSLELQAALSLSRLYIEQGKRQAAYELLAPIYGWFTEGFETPDLRDARGLLAALGA